MDTQKIESVLLEKRRELIARLQLLNEDFEARDESFESPFSEQGVELDNLDILFSMDHASRHELNQINNAINRLRRNEYYTCANCGSAIHPERLIAKPQTDICSDCALKN